MKMTTTLLGGLAFAMTTMLVSAQSIATATDRAYDAAKQFEDRGYQVVAGPSGFAQAGEKAVFKMGITEGNDYIFTIGTSDVNKVRVYVEDEWGMPLQKDSRGYFMASLAFFARYSGNVKVTVYFDRTMGRGAYSTVVCKRAVPRQNNDWGKLDGSDTGFENRDAKPDKKFDTTPAEETEGKP